MGMAKMHTQAKSTVKVPVISQNRKLIIKDQNNKAHKKISQGYLNYTEYTV